MTGQAQSGVARAYPPAAAEALHRSGPSLLQVAAGARPAMGRGLLHGVQERAEREERESLGEWGQIFRERAARGEKIKASSHKCVGSFQIFNARRLRLSFVGAVRGV